ncbi:hypothetical protein J3998_03885 [Thiomicrorhabdus sp. 6S2-11]|uniref:START domain-containing protein n=1 Tax=Thiomicrorhabdus marina TaxID=2818442 RepID=A0ABS3Q337_9GAMM|nr:START domain-containing protein [Thiomicrorhabdus marina]MBO1926706.1 hypothetical protein [Thiomicrorhabdus marina]
MFSSFAIASNSDWQINQDYPESNVKVWTKKVTGSSFYAFKGEVKVRAPMFKVLTVLANTSLMPNWYYRLDKVEVLKQINSKETIVRSITKLPWPFDNREAITKITKAHLSKFQARINVSHSDYFFPYSPNLVRINHLNGYWQLDQISEQETLITHMIESEPAGQIPAWLINQLVSEIPVYSLEKLKNLVEIDNKTLF